MEKTNQQQTDPIDRPEEVQKTKDKHIDQDFTGFPHVPSQERTINPKTKEDKVNANLIRKENYKDEDTEQSSDGSANAFSETEGDDLLRGELDDDNEKTY